MTRLVTSFPRQAVIQRCKTGQNGVQAYDTGMGGELKWLGCGVFTLKRKEETKGVDVRRQLNKANARQYKAGIVFM